MAYLAAGFFCLFLAMRGGRPAMVAAGLLAVAGFAAGFVVYPWWVPPAVAAGAGAAALVSRRLRMAGTTQWIAILVGVAFLAFALVGPADGLL
jgi:uncharacterized membrane protein YhaH (DUF805 family)